jgi:probable rRNA maturation factor
VEIIIRNFQKKIPINPKRIKTAILKVLSKESIKKSGEITVCFVSDNRIRKLNAKYLKENAPTDVLSFNLSTSKYPNSLTADIIISADTAVRNSKVYKTTPIFELNLYLIHAILHILGYKDSSPKQIRLMRKKENQYANT